MNANISPLIEQVVTLELSLREAQVLKAYLASLNWDTDERAATLDAFGGHFHKMAFEAVRNNISIALNAVIGRP